MRFVGDRVRFALRDGGGGSGWRAVLRTNLGRAAALRREIIAAHAGGPVPAGASWRDIPMQKTGDGWQIELPLAEPGFFKAKAYLLDPKGWQHWPEGPDVGISVHPDFARTANIIYCAFTRLFGPTRNLPATGEAKLEARSTNWMKWISPSFPLPASFAISPASCPTSSKSSVAAFSICCPSIQRPPPLRGSGVSAALMPRSISRRLIRRWSNSTNAPPGWINSVSSPGPPTPSAPAYSSTSSSTTPAGVRCLQENHPEFFLRHPDGTFASPGAWGTIWEDLVELKQDNVVLWDKIADALLTWCRRGVDGFRCDAGYKIPVPAWQYIIARVQDEFPETIFLLEGLGGSWEATENLLTDGGMQWAYSELFQNYSGRQIADYLDYANRQSSRVGTYVHYSETHDNDRLAPAGRGVVVAAQSPLCADQRERRIWFHLRCRMAGRRKNQGPRLYRPGLGQSRTTSSPNSRNSTGCSLITRASSTAQNSRG